jgi:hypothetical protein
VISATTICVLCNECGERYYQPVSALIVQSHDGLLLKMKSAADPWDKVTLRPGWVELNNGAVTCPKC